MPKKVILRSQQLVSGARFQSNKFRLLPYHNINMQRTAIFTEGSYLKLASFWNIQVISTYISPTCTFEKQIIGWQNGIKAPCTIPSNFQALSLQCLMTGCLNIISCHSISNYIESGRKLDIENEKVRNYLEIYSGLISFRTSVHKLIIIDPVCSLEKWWVKWQFTMDRHSLNLVTPGISQTRIYFYLYSGCFPTECHLPTK